MMLRLLTPHADADEIPPIILRSRHGVLDIVSLSPRLPFLCAKTAHCTSEIINHDHVVLPCLTSTIGSINTIHKLSGAFLQISASVSGSDWLRFAVTCLGKLRRYSIIPRSWEDNSPFQCHSWSQPKLPRPCYLYLDEDFGSTPLRQSVKRYDVSVQLCLVLVVSCSHESLTNDDPTVWCLSLHKLNL